MYISVESWTFVLQFGVHFQYRILTLAFNYLLPKVFHFRPRALSVGSRVPRTLFRPFRLWGKHPSFPHKRLRLMRRVPCSGGRISCSSGEPWLLPWDSVSHASTRACRVPVAAETSLPLFPSQHRAAPDDGALRES